MKKLLIISLLTATLFISGCKTTQTASIIKGEGIVVTTVDTGMIAWHDYVVAHLTDGKVSQTEINDVANAYGVYYTSQLSIEAALEKTVSTGSTNIVDVTIANTAVVSAETSLLALINKYLNQ